MLRSLFYSKGSTAYLAVFSLARLADPNDRRAALDELRTHLDGVTACVGAEPPPPMLLVGTRKDAVDAARQREISDWLVEQLGGRPAFRGAVYPKAGGLCYFAIENRRGFAGDDAIPSLAAAIQASIAALPALKMRVPSRWIRLFDELQQRQASQPVLPFDAVCEVGAACGLPHASHGLSLEDEVGSALRFFHGLGAIVWFAEPALREMVVLDPQVTGPRPTCHMRQATCCTRTRHTSRARAHAACTCHMPHAHVHATRHLTRSSPARSGCSTP